MGWKYAGSVRACVCVCQEILLKEIMGLGVACMAMLGEYVGEIRYRMPIHTINNHFCCIVISVIRPVLVYITRTTIGLLLFV